MVISVLQGYIGDLAPIPNLARKARLCPLRPHTMILGTKPTLEENSEFDMCHPWMIIGSFPFPVDIVRRSPSTK